MIHNISHCASADDSKTMLIHKELKGRYANIAFEYKYCDLLQPDLNFPSTIRSKKNPTTDQLHRFRATPTSTDYIVQYLQQP